MVNRVRISLLIVATCSCGATIAAYVGTALALHWPLSEANALGALTFGVIFGALGSSLTRYVVFWARSPNTAWIFAIGSALTALLCGFVSFVLNAAAAAC
jgi:hypothetical protein